MWRIDKPENSTTSVESFQRGSAKRSLWRQNFKRRISMNRLLRSSIDALRQLTRKRANRGYGTNPKICAAAGVAVVWVPELPHWAISGCARWLSDKKALVALTLRYKTDDQMWFTFFHELGHVLLHRKKRSFVLDNAANDLSDRIVDPEMQQYETEANQFAGDTLIPPASWPSLCGRKVLRTKTFTTLRKRSKSVRVSLSVDCSLRAYWRVIKETPSSKSSIGSLLRMTNRLRGNDDWKNLHNQ